MMKKIQDDIEQMGLENKAPCWLDYERQRLSRKNYNPEFEYIDKEETIYSTLKLSKTGKKLVYATKTNKVKIVDIATHNDPAGILEYRETEAVTGVDLIDQDTILVLGYKTGKILIQYLSYNSNTVRHVENSEVLDISSGNSGEFFVVGYANGSIHYFSLMDDERENKSFQRFYLNDLHSIAVSSDDHVLAAASRTQLQIYDLAYKEITHTIDLKRTGSIILPIAISKDNSYVAVNISESCVELFSVDKGERLQSIEETRRIELVGFALTQDEKLFLGLGVDSCLSVHDIQEGEEITQIRINPPRVKTYTSKKLLFPEDGKMFYIAMEDESIRGWPLIRDANVIFNKQVSKNSKISSAWILPGDKTMIGTSNGSVLLIDPSKNKDFIIANLEKVHDGAINTIAFAFDKNLVITGGADKRYNVFKYDPLTYTLQHSFKSEELSSTIAEITAYKDGSAIAIGLEGSALEIRSLEGNKVLSRFDDPKKYVFWEFDQIYNNLKISWKDKLLYIGNDKGSLNVINLETMKDHEVIGNLQTTSIQALTLDPKNKFLVVGSKDKYIKIYEMGTGDISTIDLPEDQAEIIAIEVHRTRNYLLLISNKDISVLDLRTKKILHTSRHDNCILFEIWNNPLVISHGYFTEDHKGAIIIFANGKIIIEKYYFLDEDNYPVIDYQLEIPYRANSLIPYYKLRRAYNHQIELDFHNVKAYADLLIHFSNINLWYIYFFNYPIDDPIAMTRRIIDADIPILNDKDNKSIIYYIVKSYQNLALNTIFERAEDAFDDAPQIMFKSLSGIFIDIVKTKVPKLHHFLKVCYEPPKRARGHPYPRFGDTSIFRPYAMSETRKLTSEIQKELTTAGTDPITFNCSRILFNPDYSSDENLLLMEALIQNENPEIYSSVLILKFIDWIWFKMYPFLIGLVALLTITLAFENPTPGLTLSLLIYNFFHAGYSLVQFLGRPSVYFKRIWNIIDIIRLSLLFAFLFTKRRDSENSIALEYLVSFATLTNYLKLISFFRMFSQTRNLIRVIVECIKDIVSFVVVILFLIVGFGFIFFQINNDSSTTISTSIYNVYMFLYAQWDIDKYDGFKIPFFIIVSFTLFIVLTNLLITILGETYNRVQNLAVSSNNIESLDIMIELLYVKKILARIFRCLKYVAEKTTGSITRKKEFRKYLLWVSETTGEDDDGISKWTGKTKMISVDLQKSIKKLRKGTKKNHRIFHEKLHLLNEVKKQSENSKTKQDNIQKLIHDIAGEFDIASKTENGLTMGTTLVPGSRGNL